MRKTIKKEKEKKQNYNQRSLSNASSRASQAHFQAIHTEFYQHDFGLDFFMLNQSNYLEASGLGGVARVGVFFFFSPLLLSFLV